MDQTTFPKQLLDRYVNNIATTEELEVIDHLISTGELDEMLMVHMAESWKAEEAVFESDAGIPMPNRAGRFRLWPSIAVAAAVLAAVAFGIWFYASRYPEGSEAMGDFLNYANDIAPGKQGATLTLANGKQIRLDDATNGELAKEAGMVVTKTTDGQLIYEINPAVPSGRDGDNKTNTLSTAKGETYQVVLPDKSKVWLNAASSLTYAANLNERGQRRVILEGEGYFEVTKDKAHPFIVESMEQQVEVLGTHFNINGYRDEPVTKTTLLEGSVKVSSLSPRQNVPDLVNAILKPNQQSSVTGSSGITVKDVEVSDAVAWKDGNFVFKAEPLANIMRSVARWYDIAVVYADDAPKYVPLSGVVSRSKNISVVLERMEATGSVKFKIEGRKVIVSK